MKATHFYDWRREALLKLVSEWRDPDFWAQKGNQMDSRDCADELERIAGLTLPQAESVGNGGQVFSAAYHGAESWS